jgi:hypothetical protein
MLGQAERTLATATAARDALVSQLAEPQDHRELERLGTQLSAAQAALHHAEETWLELAAEADAQGLV